MTLFICLQFLIFIDADFEKVYFSFIDFLKK